MTTLSDSTIENELINSSSGSEYDPESETTSNEDGSSEREENPFDPATKSLRKPARKRQKHSGSHHISMRKAKLNEGKGYTTRHNKIVLAKTFKNTNCGCSKGCNGFVTEEQ
ncbi:unnamed protein product, partial [Timema podura]|nr:unnamed protein product [Timema podura]